MLSGPASIVTAFATVTYGADELFGTAPAKQNRCCCELLLCLLQLAVLISVLSVLYSFMLYAKCGRSFHSGPLSGWPSVYSFARKFEAADFDEH